MASVSKRQQARNERELQDLIRTIPGNNQCADCQARNPGWASWSLGIFLCMRCASIHRKLGTHISKVKSLSMDTWSADQVDNMKQNGNIVTNNNYNPKNRKPDIPLDADEVDSAMERFIRKKYQEKSLADGKPLLPSRGDTNRGDTHPGGRETGAGLSILPENSPPPPLPPKKGKFFGFGLRASSSTYPASKNDKKNLPREPKVDSAFRISSNNHESTSKRGSQRQLSEEEIEEKLLILQNMGFSDSRRNRTVLIGVEGNMEITVESLVRIQQATKSEGVTPSSTGRVVNAPPASVAFPPPPEDFIPQPSGGSNNPFDQSSNKQSFGLSFDAPPQQQQAAAFNPAPERRIASSTNPFDTQPQTQIDQGLDQAFQNMQVSRQLFPHSTGGYPSQPPPMQNARFLHSMTPPVPQHYGYMASPAQLNTSTNPFFQSPQSSPAVVNNPYASLIQNQIYPALSANPYFSQMIPSNQLAQQAPQPQPQQQQQQQQPQPLQSSSGFNPFGIPPSQPGSPPQQAPSQPPPIYDQGPLASAPNNNFQSFLPQQNISQQSIQIPLQQQGQAQFESFQFGQPQFQPRQPQYQQVQQFQQHPQTQFQVPSQSLYGQQPQQPILPQQTGRIDKSSILALYNYPQLAPRPLASIPEPTEVQQPISQAPTDLLSAVATSQTSKRSATMPVSASSMHSAGGGGSRNPFLNTSNNSGGTLTPMPGYGPGIGARHASAESVSLNNPALEGGRHSPDAFASLSARYVR